MKTTALLVEANIKGQLAGKKMAPVILQSNPGVGKSSIIKQICVDNGWELIYVSLASASIETFGGLPTDRRDESVAKYNINNSSLITEWSCPEIIYQANALVGKGKTVVISLEDIHESDRSTQKALYELLLERGLKGFFLDNDVAMVGSMNTSDEAGFQAMSSAIVNRLAFLKFEPTFDELHEVSLQFYHTYIASFLKSYKSYLHEQESVTSPFGTPRSWRALSENLSMLDDKFIVQHIQVLAKQYVSIDAANALHKHVVYMTNIDFEGMIKNKKPLDVSKLNTLEQVLHTYILNYIVTPKDALYLVDIINDSMDEPTFLGFMLGMINEKYKARDKAPLSLGIDMLITKLLGGSDKLFCHKMTATNKKAMSKLVFKDAGAVLSKSSEYLI